MRPVAAALAVLFAACGSEPPPAGFDWPFFHGDRARTGWNPRERQLTPQTVNSAGFGHLWDSPQLDSARVGTTDFAPHLYASPLYDDATRSVLAATSNGWVYAISASDGRLRWSLHLADPMVNSHIDVGMPLGVLSTPALDVPRRRLYVVTQSATANAFQAFAIDVDSGSVLHGWPLTFDPMVIMPLNSNGPATFPDPLELTQRGALNLSADANTLVVPFGTSTDHGSGWMVSIDTGTIAIVGAFAATPLTDLSLSGAGIWGSGGAAIDERGQIFDTTGNADEKLLTAPNVWGASLLRWTPQLALSGTYTPWNFCQLEKADADLAGSSPTVLPALEESTATPRLVAFGSKQGNVYLVDRDQMTGSLQSRPSCSMDPSSDTSLLGPGPQPQFKTRGPLNVFGPYTEQYGNVDYAKMRTTLSWFDAGARGKFLFAVGASKQAADSKVSVPPSVARLALQLSPQSAAWLSIDGLDDTLALVNPGPPLVTSDGHESPIVWILDENRKRVDSLATGDTSPILYAVDGMTLKVLWQSGASELHPSGKYNSVLVVGGVVYVGTDRIQAFGLRGP